jgi:hypothetical protein
VRWMEKMGVKLIDDHRRSAATGRSRMYREDRFTERPCSGGIVRYTGSRVRCTDPYSCTLGTRRMRYRY